MDTKKYEIFLEIVKQGSFTKAAEALNYTQSGVTQVMNTLEKEIGYPIFVRSKKGVSVTKAGEELIPYMQAVLRDQESLEQKVSFSKGLQSGSVTVGSFMSISISYLPRIMSKFQEDYPNIDVTVLEGGDAEIEGWLNTQTADIALCSKHSSIEFDWLPLFEDELVAVLPADHPMLERESVPMEFFEGTDFIISDRDFDYEIPHALRQANVTPQIRFRSRSDFAIAAMVESGLYCSILPALILKKFSGKVVTRPLDPPYPRYLGVAVKNCDEISPAAAEFVRYARRIITGATGKKIPWEKATHETEK